MLLGCFSCAWQREMPYHGRLYVSARHICFHSNVLLKDIKVSCSEHGAGSTGRGTGGSREHGDIVCPPPGTGCGPCHLHLSPQKDQHSAAGAQRSQHPHGQGGEGESGDSGDRGSLTWGYSECPGPLGFGL